jgi:hypothetical protein
MSNVLLGRIYKHREGGLEYRTIQTILDATGYEAAGNVKESILYEQLISGKYPAGTKWVRDTEDFLNNFDLVENNEQ